MKQRQVSALMIMLMATSGVAYAGLFGNSNNLFKPQHKSDYVHRAVAPVSVARPIIAAKPAAVPTKTSIPAMTRVKAYAPTKPVATTKQVTTAKPHMIEHTAALSSGPAMHPQPMATVTSSAQTVTGAKPAATVDPFTGEQITYEQKLTELDNQRLETQLLQQKLNQANIDSQIAKLKNGGHNVPQLSQAAVDARIDRAISKQMHRPSHAAIHRQVKPAYHTNVAPPSYGPQVVGEVSFGGKHYSLVQNGGAAHLSDTAVFAGYGWRPSSKVSLINVSDNQPAPGASSNIQSAIANKFAPGVATMPGFPIGGNTAQTPSMPPMPQQ